MKKLMKIVTILIIALFAITTYTLAVGDSYEITVKTSQTTLKPGDTFQITIGLDKIAIESGDKGIGAYSAKVQYDASIFDIKEVKSIGKWETPMMNNGAFTGTTNDATCVNTKQDIAIITFTVKQNATEGQKTIKITDFSGSTAEKDVPATNQQVTVNVEKQKEDNNNTTNNETTNNTTNENKNDTTNNTNNNTSTGKNTISNTDNTTANNKLPQTGNSNGMLWASIAMLVMASVISFIRYVKLNQKNK